MAVLRLIAAPIRSFLRFPLVQLAFVVAIVLLLQAADEASLFGRVFGALDALVDGTIALFADLFRVKSFTRSGLTLALMIGYVYLVGWAIVVLLRFLLRLLIDVIGRSNAFGLRHSIARQRGIAAYRAWVPLERIRPAAIPQQVWEEEFAWPADNKPPYPPLHHRILRGVLSYLMVAAAIAVLLQLFTPLPALSWLGKLAEPLVRWVQERMI